MGFKHCIRLVIAAVLSVNSLTVDSQSTRTANMETGTTITSITSLQAPRHPAPPFGAIDSSYSESLSLDVSAIPDVPSAELTDQLQGQNLSAHPGLRSLTTPQAGFMNAVPSGSAGRMSSSLAVMRTSYSERQWSQPSQGISSATPQNSSRGSAQATFFASPPSGSLPSPPSASLAPPSTISSPSVYASGAGYKSQSGAIASGSMANVPAAGNHVNFHPLGNVDRWPHSSGSQGTEVGSMADRSSFRVGRVSKDDSASESLSDLSASELARDAAPDDAESVTGSTESVNGGDSTTESRTTTRDRRVASSFFETVQDPFIDVLPNPFQGGEKRLNVERACADACMLKKSSVRTGISDSRTAASDSSTETSESGNLTQLSHGSLLEQANEQSNELPHSRLERILGSISDNAPGSGYSAQSRLRDLKRVKRGFDPVDQRKSPR